MAESAELTAHQQLLQLQRATLSRLMEVLPKNTKENREIRQYRTRYRREVQKFQAISSKSDLVADISSASLVFCGDFHTLSQSQRTVVKILRRTIEKRPMIRLGLEMLTPDHEAVAERFIRGKISESEFLDGISYRKRWGFPWRHYKQIIDFAKVHQLPLIGLNYEKSDTVSLKERDDRASEIIVHDMIQHPDALLFCFYGDLHIGKPHIPDRVRRLLKKHDLKRKTVTIFQNSEAIYWQLAEKGLENVVDVVRLRAHAYCVLSAAPWVKWQSYLSWLEDQSDLLDPPDGEDLGEAMPDYYHQVLETSEKIAGFLKLKPPNLEEFSIYTARDAKIIDAIDRYCDSCVRKDVPIDHFIRAEIIENRSIYFPENSVLYLSDLSQNRVAEKAIQHITAKMNDHLHLFDRKADIKEIFYRLVLWNAVGFFGSKMMNPKRKCDHYRDYERVLKTSRVKKLTPSQKNAQQIARMLLAHRAYEIRVIRTGKLAGAPRKIFKQAPRMFFLSANGLGQILADRLYLAVISGDLSVNILTELVSAFPNQNQEARSKYFEIAGMIRKHLRKPTSKEDRF